jgi:serine phosphatase RsbU (regulator of sigma subunit)
MEILLAVAKKSKSESNESGDNLEVVERPNGGVSLVMADARSSGKAAKLVSTLVVRKVIGLLAEGVRDGAAARAASDYLYTEKGGGASAYLNVLSVDLETDTIVLTSNNPTPIIISRGDRIESIMNNASPIGLSRNIRPEISEIPLETGITIVIFTDGVLHAGVSNGNAIDICTLLDSVMEEQNPKPEEIADTILAEAIRLDQGMPNDDMTVVVLRVVSKETDQIRRMSMHVPVERRYSQFYEHTEK